MTDEPDDKTSPDREQSDTDKTVIERLNDHEVTHTKATFRTDRAGMTDNEKARYSYREYGTFAVPIAEVLRNGDTVPDSSATETYELLQAGDPIGSLTHKIRRLRKHENAPTWVTSWVGPSEVSWDQLFSSPQQAMKSDVDVANAIVTCHPQIRVGGEMVDADDTWTFTLPPSATITDDGESIVEDGSEAANALAHHKYAPEIVRMWSSLEDDSEFGGPLTRHKYAPKIDICGVPTAWNSRVTIDEFRIGNVTIDQESILEITRR